MSLSWSTSVLAEKPINPAILSHDIRKLRLKRLSSEMFLRKKRDRKRTHKDTLFLRKLTCKENSTKWPISSTQKKTNPRNRNMNAELATTNSMTNTSAVLIAE